MEDREHKVAVLLSALGDGAIDSALAMLDEDCASGVRRKLEQYQARPVPQDEVESVLEDFDKFFRFALEATGTESYWSQFLEEESPEDSESEMPETHPPAADSKPKFRIFQPTEDSIHDLNLLNPVQIVGALKAEQPKTIALVLGCLEQPTAAKCLDLLPADSQMPVFNFMLAGATAPDDLLQRIVRTTVEKGLLIEDEETEEPDAEHKIAQLMRELPKDVRSKILDQLREDDEETAERIQLLLYVFEDIVKYDDRSIQKILGEVDKSLLVISLQNTPPDLQDKILRNLSKRAREALEEEIEFQKKESDDAVNAARESITAIISKLDQSDQIQLEDA